MEPWSWRSPATQNSFLVSNESWGREMVWDVGFGEGQQRSQDPAVPSAWPVGHAHCSLLILAVTHVLSLSWETSLDHAGMRHLYQRTRLTWLACVSSDLQTL